MRASLRTSHTAQALVSLLSTGASRDSQQPTSAPNPTPPLALLPNNSGVVDHSLQPVSGMQQGSRNQSSVSSTLSTRKPLCTVNPPNPNHTLWRAQQPCWLELDRTRASSHMTLPTSSPPLPKLNPKAVLED